MSQYTANPISPPKPSTVTQASVTVVYNKAAHAVSGLDGVLNTGKGVLARAFDGVNHHWFSCKRNDAACEVMAQYHAGNYLEVTWYTEN